MRPLLSKILPAVGFIIALNASIASPQDGFRIDLDYGEIEKIRVDPEGAKILIGGTFNLGGLAGDRVISRHHPNGERDIAFNTTSFTPPNGRIFSFVRLPDGQILVGGDFSGATYPANLAMLRGDGVWQNSFNLGVNGSVRVIESFLPAGQEPEIYLGGAFDQVDGEDRTGIARLANGERIDSDFNPPALAPGGTVRAIARQPDGRILIGGSNLRLRDDSTAGLALFRLFPDGSHDDSFIFASNLGIDGADSIHAITLQNDGQILVGGDFTIGTGGLVRSHLARLNPNGSIDASLDAGLDAPVIDVALQADGRAILVGEFNSPGFANGKFSRIGLDGSHEPDFSRLLEPDDTPLSIAIQGDGGILIAGKFSTVGPNGFYQDDLPGAFRLLPVTPRIHQNVLNLGVDRDLDIAVAFALEGLSPGSKPIYEPDGTLLIKGSFTYLGDTYSFFRASVSDGTPIPGFNATLGRAALAGGVPYPQRAVAGGSGGGASGAKDTFRILDDGRILIADAFTELNGENIAGAAILHPDGSRDTSFTPPVLANLLSFPPSTGLSPRIRQPYFIERDRQGRFYVGGVLPPLLPDTSASIISGAFRLHPDGSLDESFRSGNSSYAIANVGAWQRNNRPTAMSLDWERENLYLARADNSGTFANRIARLLPDGNPDGGQTQDNRHRLLLYQSFNDIQGLSGISELNGMTPRREGGFLYHGHANVVQSFVSPLLVNSADLFAGGLFVLNEAGAITTELFPLNALGTPTTTSGPEALGAFTDRLGCTYAWARPWESSPGTPGTFLRFLSNGSVDPSFTMPAAFTPLIETSDKSSYLIQQPDGKLLTSTTIRVGNIEGIPSETLVRAGSEVRWLREGNGPPVGAPPRLWISFESGTDATFRQLPGEMVWSTAGGGRWIYQNLPNFPGTFYLKVRAEMPNGTGLFDTPVHQFVNPGSQAPSADIQLFLFPAAPSAVIGDTVELSLTVSNLPGNPPNGNQPNVTLRAPLPAGLTYVSHQFPGGSYDPVTGIATIALLGTSSSRTLVITATMEAEGDRFFQAHAVGTVDDIDTSNNQVAVEVGREFQPTDIEVTVAATPTSGTLITPVDFTVTVTNHGPGPAKDVRADQIFIVQPGFDIDAGSVTTSAGISSGLTWSVHDDFATLFNLGRIDMAAGASETLTFTATPNPDTNAYKGKMIYEVTSLTPDPDLSNNRGEVELNFTDPTQNSDLSVTITASSDNPVPGEIVDITVVVENPGPDPAFNIFVEIPIPDGFERLIGPYFPIAPNPSQGTHYVNNDFWFVGALGPIGGNTSATLIFRVLTLPEGDTGFTVNTSSHSTDPVPSNNTANLNLGIAPESSAVLSLLSAEAVSATQREIVLRLKYGGSGTPLLEESSDLGASDPWSEVSGVSFVPVAGEPGVLEATITRPLSIEQRFFRIQIQP